MRYQSLQEICGAAARVWVLTKMPGGKEPDSFKHYVYVDRRWVEITIRYNGEEKPPRRRKEDKDEDDLIAD